MRLIEQQKSKDGSVKFLLELQDGNTVETLYMHDNSSSLTYNSTICVSSQVGCKVGCLFCATGKQGYKRNLTAAEIIEQVRVCYSYCGQTSNTTIKAVVFAGMGEPLLNYENVKEAILQLHNTYGMKNFELASVGIAPGIYKLAEDFENTNVSIRLNLSLHASDDEIRSRMIPFNNRYHISDILEAAVDYANTFKCKVRIRYMLLKGINDSKTDISKLCSLLKNKPLKLVLSAYNDNSIKGLVAPDEEDVQGFFENIRQDVETDIFYNFGKDILGGCGQLRQLQKSKY